MPFFSHCVLAASVLVSGAVLAEAGTPFDVVAKERPELRLERYFVGRTHSWGVFETRAGAPKEVLRGSTTGRLRGDVLQFEQDLQFSSGKKMHRSWTIRRVDGHRYEATGTGIVGAARAEARGNAVHLEFTLDAIPGNPLGRVRMSQWLYLQEGGRVLVNRAKLTKAGVKVAELTECFAKDR
jgi:hypothetical protein